MPHLTSQALVQLETALDYARLAALVGTLALTTTALRHLCGLGNGRDELVAVARASVQLFAVGLVITAVLDRWGLTAAFVAVMIVVATATSGGRLRATSRLLPVVPIALAALPVTALLLASGLLPLVPVSVVPTAGILVGNAMNATTLSGRRGLDALVERRGEVEAALALGFLDRDARLMVIRPAARLALVPEVDRTRTVGLVTLPGAFVGTLLGGATPVQAAALQLVVLAGILLTQSIAVALTVEFVARGRLHRA